MFEYKTSKEDNVQRNNQEPVRVGADDRNKSGVTGGTHRKMGIGESTYDTEALHKMLTYKRHVNSASESECIALFVDTLQKYADEFWVDKAGNRYFRVGKSRTLFTAHTDTVHREGGRQEVIFDGKTFSVSQPEVLNAGGKSFFSSGCLGADDGAGMWIMSEMIKAGVPGWYQFTRGEETGGVGSSFAVANHSDFLSKFDRAVAFDRRGTQSVITHQGFGRCCSNTFADALCAALGEANPKLDLFPDSTGIFTDTANYIDDIGECTNISCGYDSEHSRSETLDYEFLCNLLDGLIKVEWETLPTDRQPGEEEVPAYRDFGFASYGASYGASAGSYALDDLEELSRMKYRDLLDWVRKHTKDPEYIADVLYEALAEMQPAPGSAQNGVYFEDEDYL